MKILILGFYGVGKTTVLKEYPKAVDLTDVSLPSLLTLQEYWTNDDYEIVMADPYWTKVILQSGIPFYIVIPSTNRRYEFIDKFKERSKKGLGAGHYDFYNYIDRCWEGWIDFYNYKIPCKDVITLKYGQWMKDALQYIIKIENQKDEDTISH